MSMTDPIGDMLTRLRNAQSVRKLTTECLASQMAANVLEVLKQEGFIRDFRWEEVRPGIKKLLVDLKYYEGRPVIREIKRVSTPGRRIYKSARDIPLMFGGLGVTILSTSRGVISDRQAREQGIGGEIVCQVF